MVMMRTIKTRTPTTVTVSCRGALTDTLVSLAWMRYAAWLEAHVLERLVYKHNNQHRRNVYFQRLVHVRSMCRRLDLGSVFADLVNLVLRADKHASSQSSSSSSRSSSRDRMAAMLLARHQRTMSMSDLVQRVATLTKSKSGFSYEEQLKLSVEQMRKDSKVPVSIQLDADDAQQLAQLVGATANLMRDRIRAIGRATGQLLSLLQRTYFMSFSLTSLALMARLFAIDRRLITLCSAVYRDVSSTLGTSIAKYEWLLQPIDVDSWAFDAKQQQRQQQQQQQQQQQKQQQQQHSTIGEMMMESARQVAELSRDANRMSREDDTDLNHSIVSAVADSSDEEEPEKQEEKDDTAAKSSQSTDSTFDLFMKKQKKTKKTKKQMKQKQKQEESASTFDLFGLQPGTDSDDDDTEKKQRMSEKKRNTNKKNKHDKKKKKKKKRKREELQDSTAVATSLDDLDDIFGAMSKAKSKTKRRRKNKKKRAD